MRYKRTRKKECDLKLATWNVRTMLKPGKMQEIGREVVRYGFDIVAVQEIRWKGAGEIKKKDFTVFYSGKHDVAGQAGTGFFITNKIKNNVISFEPINERLCKIRLKGKF